MALSELARGQKIGLVLAAIVYIGGGTLHFLAPTPYLRIMPPFLPWHLALVYISGICEILGGVGLLVPRARKAAGWGLVVLLIAVFPANVYMATNPAEAGAAGIPAMLRWGRLPLQGLLIWWVIWAAVLRRSKT